MAGSCMRIGVFLADAFDLSSIKWDEFLCVVRKNNES